MISNIVSQAAATRANAKMMEQISLQNQQTSAEFKEWQAKWDKENKEFSDEMKRLMGNQIDGGSAQCRSSTPLNNNVAEIAISPVETGGVAIGNRSGRL
ncbi:hypothetical protein [Brucella anthropi]|uniref:hypothetical protein n=1 Tax=Brucella anthropi TaxID=529 RepID=UPI00384D4E32